MKEMTDIVRMTDERRRSLNDILVKKLNEQVEYIISNGGFNQDIVQCTYIQCFIENDSDFGDFFEELWLKIALTNTCLKDIDKLDYGDVMNRVLAN